MPTHDSDPVSHAMQGEAVCSVLDKVDSSLHKTMDMLALTGDAFSPFSENLINMSEMGISSILAMLLSPKRRHYQGVYFLDKFISMLPDFPLAPPRNYRNVHVETERSTWEIGSNRRIDIFVDCPEFIIGIENKIWAQDQEMQLADYLCWLKRISNGRKFFLVYLTPYGHSPNAYTLPEAVQKKYQGCHAPLAWTDLVAMFEESSRQLPARIGIFVRDFCAAVLEKIGEPNALRVDMNSGIVNLLANRITSDEFLAAHSIFKNYKDASEFVINEWSRRLNEELEKRGIKGKINRILYPNYDPRYEQTNILTIDYNKQKLCVGIYTTKYYNWVLSWGLYVQAWEFNSMEECMEFPTVKEMMAKIDVDALPENKNVSSQSL